jgi:L-alanine-DL-glutamate epimerase-like enolase superfamily enzyme
MKISRITYHRLDLTLSVPYTIAYESVSRVTNFILKLETGTAVTGFGCAAPDLNVTGETEEEVELAIRNVVIPYLEGKDPFTYVLLLDELRQRLDGKAATLAMADMALLDLVSRKAGVPLYKFLGGYKPSIPTSITIGILPLEETLKRAAEFVGAGFLILKVKGGKVLDEDVEKMIRLREAFPGVSMRFDANQGYTVEQALEFVRKTARVGIEIFEQPTLVQGDENLGEIKRQISLPVMADESIRNLADAFRLARHERIDMVNIKLMKVGGILEGMHINSVARSAGLEVMAGCIDECGLGISAGLHFALSRPNIRYADLDGHLDLLDDPFSGLFQLRQGVLYPSDSPGLGPMPAEL